MQSGILMIRRVLINLLLVFVMLFTIGCGDAKIASGKDTSTQNKEDTAVEKTYSILFIGNSYTYYNDMPTAIFKQFAISAGYKVEVNAITNGGHKLSEFAEPSDEFGARVESVLKSDKRYDYIILQEQSLRPTLEGDVNKFYDAVRNLAERIRKTGAKPILYSTWGRKTGSTELNKYSFTNETMTWKLAASYQTIGDELEIDVAHAGLAFYDVFTNHSDIELYNLDKSHPSYEGSYLAATTLFAKIFNLNPTTVSYTGRLSQEKADILCEAAKRVVFETPSITEEYKTVTK